jgi:ferritin-like metal-binding protein YciE
MIKDFNDLLLDELHDILSSEEQIVEALPVMVEAAESLDLKKAFATHLEESKDQIKRLEKVFNILHEERKEKFCLRHSSYICN